MTKKNTNTLSRTYKKYLGQKHKKQKNLSFFRAFMPEIIFITSKLEGESITRKLISALFR